MKRATSLAAAVLLAGCGGLGNLFDAGNNTGSCSSDSSCATTEICHPVSKKCVTTCTSASTCNSTSLSCSDVAGTSSKVCSCTGTGMCGLTEVCQPWAVCTDKCAGSLDCPSGYTCNTSTGVCAAPNNNMDGGTDGGTSCSTANTQPDTCGYGSVCGTSGCATAQKGTCSNFSGTHSTASWSAATSTGAVIYSLVDETPDDTTKCTGTATAYTVTIKAYLTTGTFPAQKSNLPGFKYVTTTGGETDIPLDLLQQANYSVSTDSKNATMKFTLCAPSSPSTIVAGFYFTGGNPYCATLNHN